MLPTHHPDQSALARKPQIILAYGQRGADLSNSLPLHVRPPISRCRLFPRLALRVTYIGELGWELHVPSCMRFNFTICLPTMRAKSTVYANAGMQPCPRIRLEKAYQRIFGVDVTIPTTRSEAGLGFAVKLDKPNGFMGRRLAQIKAAGTPKRRMLQFLLKDSCTADGMVNENHPSGWHAGGIYPDRSYVTHLGGAVWNRLCQRRNEPLSAEVVKTGRWNVEIATARSLADAALKPRLIHLGACEEGKRPFGRCRQFGSGRKYA